MKKILFPIIFFLLIFSSPNLSLAKDCPSRCSANYGCQRAAPYTSSDDDCNRPVGTVNYSLDCSCPVRNGAGGGNDNRCSECTSNPNTNTPKNYSSCSFQKYVDTNIFTIIWNWILSLFQKPYDIDTNREDLVKIKDFSEYGNVKDPEYKEKHSYAGSRSTDNNTQDCLKGRIIQKVLLGQANDQPIGIICLDGDCNFPPKKVSDLGKYLIQINQKFICDANNKKIDTPADLISIASQKENIPSYELSCFPKVYDDFFLTPVNGIAIGDDPENTKKIMDQTIPDEYMPNQNVSIPDREKNLDLWYSPQSEIDNKKAGGLSGLRPESEK